MSRWTLLVCALLPGVAAAQMTVITKDGRRIPVAVKKDEVAQIVYEEAPAPGGKYWKLVKVESVPPRLQNGPQPPDSSFQFPCPETACESNNTFRNSTHLKARHGWTRLPAKLTPGEVVPVTFRLDVLESRLGPGGMSATIDGRFAGQGWALLESPQGRIEVNNSQPPGTSLQRANARHKAPPGAAGQKVVYEVSAITANTEWVYRYLYEWVD